MQACVRAFGTELEARQCMLFRFLPPQTTSVSAKVEHHSTSEFCTLHVPDTCCQQLLAKSASVAVFAFVSSFSPCYKLKAQSKHKLSNLCND